MRKIMGLGQKNKEIDMRVITMVTNMILLILGLAYVVAVTVTGHNGTLWYKMSVMILMMGYSVLFNIAGLYGMNAFEKMTRQQGRSYFGYMIFDAVELCFLAMFVVNVGDFDEPFHYISLGVFIILTIPRHIMYHTAVDGVKSEENGNSGYHTVTAMHRYKVADDVQKSRTDKKDVKPNRSGRDKFPEPGLKEDRFVNMKLEGFVDSARSVDDKGNLGGGQKKDGAN